MLFVWVCILLWFSLKCEYGCHVVCISRRGSNREVVSVTKTAHVGSVCPPPIPVVGSVCPPSIPATVGSAGLTVKCVPVPTSVFPTCVECVDDDVST